MTSSKSMLHAAFVAFAAIILCPGFGLAANGDDAASIHERIWTVDAHVDTPLLMRALNIDIGIENDFDTCHCRVDLPRMELGGLDAEFFAVFVSQGNRTREGYAAARENAVELIDLVHAALDENSDLGGLAVSIDDALELEQEGRRAIFLGMENGYPLGKDLRRVEEFYNLGVRYITLAHESSNDLADSSTDDPEHNGLSRFGKKVVGEMNRLGMLVDVSHMSDEALLDTIRASTAPVIASHSGARSVYDHPRNIDDTGLKAIADNGGVVQANFMYVTGDNATVADMVDHIDHIVRVAGIDHAGIGSDFDGGGKLIGCSDVSQMGNITLELFNRGYTETEIAKIWGGNLARVMQAVQSIRISRFTAWPRIFSVVLIWTTQAEGDVTAFNLYRAENEAGPYVKVNSSQIPARGSGDTGSLYRYVDRAAGFNKKNYYRLEAVGSDNSTTLRGRATATPGLFFWLPQAG